MSKRAIESTLFRVNKILGISDSYEAPAKLLKILQDPEERTEVFYQFMKEFDYDFSYEWFYNYSKTNTLIARTTNKTSLLFVYQN